MSTPWTTNVTPTTSRSTSNPAPGTPSLFDPLPDDTTWRDRLRRGEPPPDVGPFDDDGLLASRRALARLEAQARIEAGERLEVSKRLQAPLLVDDEQHGELAEQLATLTEPARDGDVIGRDLPAFGIEEYHVGLADRRADDVSALWRANDGGRNLRVANLEQRAGAR